MESIESLDRMILEVQRFDRERCVAYLKSARRPRLDFTRAYLDGLSLDRLRHVVLAVVIQGCKPPVAQVRRVS